MTIFAKLKTAELKNTLRYNGKNFKSKETLLIYFLSISKMSYTWKEGCTDEITIKPYKAVEDRAIGKGIFQLNNSMQIKRLNTDDIIERIQQLILPEIRDKDRKAYIRGNNIVFYDGGFLGEEFADYSFSIVISKIYPLKNIVEFKIFC